jgi:hypothetical protein
MRRLSLTLLCGLILAPAAVAAVRATGDGVLELRNVDAKATITGKGAIWGQLDGGTLKVTDANLDDNLVAQVSGAERTRPTTEPGVTIYSGKNIHFRFTGGRYKFSITGTGIDVTAVGVGKAWLAGDIEQGDDGDYAIDNGKWQPVLPVLPPLLQPRAVLFGQQPLVGP